MADMSLTPRQAELADAVLGLIAREGIAGVSYRAVAAESGWSLGAVQKAFPSKGEMLSAAFARLRAQSGPTPTAPPGVPTVREWLVQLLLGILPLDDARRAAQRQGDAFAQHALTDPSVAAAIAESDAQIRGLIAGLIARSRAAGEPGSPVDPDTAAWAVLALAQGLAAQLLYAPEPEDTVRTRVDAALAALVG